MTSLHRSDGVRNQSSRRTLYAIVYRRNPSDKFDGGQLNMLCSPVLALSGGPEKTSVSGFLGGKVWSATRFFTCGFRMTKTVGAT